MSNYQPPQGGQPAGYGQSPGYPYQSPGFEPQPPRQGMGCGTKVLIALGIAFALGLVLCCGIGGYFFYYVKSSIVEDPAEVAAMTDEITQIDIPQPLRPAGGMRFKIPFSSRVAATAVFYGDHSGDSMLMLIAMGDAFDDQTREGIEDGFRRQGVQKREGEQLTDKKTQHKELTIRNEPAAFTIISGIGAESKKPRIRVEGTFRGKTGPVVLVSDVDADTIGQEKVVKMLESIK